MLASPSARIFLTPIIKCFWSGRVILVFIFSRIIILGLL